VLWVPVACSVDWTIALCGSTVDCIRRFVDPPLSQLEQFQIAVGRSRAGRVTVSSDEQRELSRPRESRSVDK